jgi:outer membrane protein assembly factor BamB
LYYNSDTKEITYAPPGCLYDNSSQRITVGDTAGIGTETNAFYINPIRNDTTNIAQSLYYNLLTKEITYAPPPSASTNPYSLDNACPHVGGNYNDGSSRFLVKGPATLPTFKYSLSSASDMGRVSFSFNNENDTLITSQYNSVTSKNFLTPCNLNFTEDTNWDNTVSSTFWLMGAEVNLTVDKNNYIYGVFTDSTAATTEYRIHCFRMNGTVKWISPVIPEDCSNSFITLGLNSLYIVSITPGVNMNVYSFNKYTGEQEWIRTFSSANVGMCVTIDKNNDVIVCTGSGNYVFCLNAANGFTKWNFIMGHPIARPMVGSDNTVYCFEYSGGGRMYAFKDGIVKWVYETGGAKNQDKYAVAMTLEGNILYGPNNSNLVCLNKDTGEVMWTTNLVAKCNRIVVDKVGTIFASNMNKDLFAINPNTGATLWKYTDPYNQVITDFAIGPKNDIYVLNNSSIKYLLR